MGKLEGHLNRYACSSEYQAAQDVFKNLMIHLTFCTFAACFNVKAEKFIVESCNTIFYPIGLNTCV